MIYLWLLITCWQEMCAFPAASSLPPQKLPLLHFFLTSMLMNSWQISDLCFDSFTFPDGNILADLEKKKRRWTLFENLKLKRNIFHLTSLLSAGGSLEISLKWRLQADYPENWKRSSFYPPHLLWALLYGAIIWSSLLSPQTGFGHKLLGQDREYCFYDICSCYRMSVTPIGL